MGDFTRASTTHTARIDHAWCDFCFQPIAKGTRYTRWSGAFDGYWFVCKVHVTCKPALDLYIDDDPDGTMPGRGSISIGEYRELFEQAGTLADALTYFPDLKPQEAT